MLSPGNVVGEGKAEQLQGNQGMTLRTARRHALMKARLIQAAGHRVGETDGEDTFIHLNLSGSGRQPGTALAILGGFWRQYE